MRKVFSSDLDTFCHDFKKHLTRTFDAMSFSKHPLESQYKELKSEWSKRTPNLEKVGQMLEQLKSALIKAGGFLTSTSSGKSGKEDNRKPELYMTISRNMLELAVEFSVTIKDFEAYERNMALLNVYYYDYGGLIPESEHMHMFMGLNLLYMLAINRIADFHIELERLPLQVKRENKYISPVLALENFVMEGRYNKILSAKNSMPSDLYNNFMEILITTVREEIASCLEKSYEKISVQQAALRLGLRDKAELRTIAERRKWVLDREGNYNFAEMFTKPKEPLTALDIAEQTLIYARELEKIV